MWGGGGGAGERRGGRGNGGMTVVNTPKLTFLIKLFVLNLKGLYRNVICLVGKATVKYVVGTYNIHLK